VKSIGGFLVIWKNRAFVRMYGSYAISTFGDWFDAMALMILFSFTWHASPLMIALLPLTYALPGVLLGQWAGVMADRMQKARLMIWADWIRAVLTAGILFAPGPFWVLPLLAVRSVASVVNLPAQQALTRLIVEKDQLYKATTLNGTVFQLAKVLGPIMGAGTVAAFSPKAAILINMASFAVSALLLMPVRREEDKRMSELPAPEIPHTESNSGFLQLWKEGWQALLTTRVLMASFLFGLLSLLAILLVDFQFAVLLREFAPHQPELTGWVVSAIGLGALATVALLNKLKEIKDYGGFQTFGIVLIGLMFAGLGFFPKGAWGGWLLLSAFAGGIGTGFTSVAMNYLLQKETPPGLLGRISGIQTSLWNLVMLVAPLLGGVLIEWLGAAVTFQTIGILIGSIGIIGFVFKRVIWGRRAVPENRRSAVETL
jgi:MFS family permease